MTDLMKGKSRRHHRLGFRHRPLNAPAHCTPKARPSSSSTAPRTDWMKSARSSASAHSLSSSIFRTASNSLASLPRILEIAGGLDIFHAGTPAPISAGRTPKAIPMPGTGCAGTRHRPCLPPVHAVLPHMIAQKSGDILFTSSIAGVVPVVWGTDLHRLEIACRYSCT